jgi:hypothetical protein
MLLEPPQVLACAAVDAEMREAERVADDSPLSRALRETRLRDVAPRAGDCYGRVRDMVREDVEAARRSLGSEQERAARETLAAFWQVAEL